MDFQSKLNEMKTTQIFTLLMILVFAWHGPDSHAQEEETDRSEPKIDIRVHKDTDEDGNIIRMDSSFTWSWSGSDDLDSVMSEFSNQFNMDFNFPMDFSFDFHVPEISTGNFSFNFGDSALALDDLDDFLEDFESQIHKFHDLNIHVDPFESWGGEEAFRKHFEEKFDHQELEKRIESFFDNEDFQKKMEQMMEKQHEFMEKHQDLIEKYQDHEQNRQDGEGIYENRYRYHKENGTKAI